MNSLVAKNSLHMDAEGIWTVRSEGTIKYFADDFGSLRAHLAHRWAARSTSACSLLAEQTLEWSGSHRAGVVEQSGCYPASLSSEQAPFLCRSVRRAAAIAKPGFGSVSRLHHPERKRSIFSGCTIGSQRLWVWLSAAVLVLQRSQALTDCVDAVLRFEASSQDLLSIKEFSDSHKAFEKPQIFILWPFEVAALFPPGD